MRVPWTARRSNQSIRKEINSEYSLEGMMLSAEELMFWNCYVGETLESPLDCKEIQPVQPKGDQSWVFIGRTDAEAEAPVLWLPDEKS